MGTNLNNLGLKNNPDLPNHEKAKIIASLLSNDPLIVHELEHTLWWILDGPYSFYTVLKEAFVYMDFGCLAEFDEKRMATYIQEVEQLRSLMLNLHIENIKKGRAE